MSFLRRAESGAVLTRARKPYARSTLVGYESVLRNHVLDHVDPVSGAPMHLLRVDEVVTRTVQGLVDSLTAARSAEVARLAAAATNAVLVFAYGRGFIHTPPVKPVMPSPHPRRERTLTIQEADRLVTTAQADDERLGRSLMHPLVVLLLGTGLRISEALGLVWGPEGVDLSTNPPTATVRFGKTAASARRVALDAESAAALAAHHAATGRPADGRLIFARRDGSPYSRSGAPRAGLARVQAAAGLEGLGPHALRHSHASWLASSMMPPVALAYRMGHSDPAFTARRYQHAMQADVDEAPAFLERVRERDRRRTGA